MPLDEWYPVSRIDFHRRQTLWLIGHLDLLEEGIYPPEPDIYLTEVLVRQGKKRVYIEIECKKSSYIDPRIKKKAINKHAPFEKTSVIYAELSWRLEATGKDGKLLLAEVAAGYTIFSDEAWAALNFLSGWRTKKGVYSVWKAKKRWRKKIKIYPSLPT